MRISVRECLVQIAILMAVALGGAAYAQDEVTLPNDVASGWPGTWLKSMHNGFKPHGFAIVESGSGAPIRLGQQSIRFEVQPGDCGNNGGWDDCANDRERHELSQIDDPQRHGHENWFSWSIFIPEDLPLISPAKLHMGQFHQMENNVVFLFSLTPEGYVIDNQSPGYGQTKEIQTLVPLENAQGRWIDVLVHAQWSEEADGAFTVYVDHELAYQYNGANVAPSDEGFYKFGIYRSFISRYLHSANTSETPTQIVFYDEVHRGQNLVQVDRVGVAALQELLAENGHYTSTVDGLWGPRTKEATNRYLASVGRDSVDEYSQELWDLL